MGFFAKTDDEVKPALSIEDITIVRENMGQYERDTLFNYCKTGVSGHSNYKAYETMTMVLECFLEYGYQGQTHYFDHISQLKI